MIIDVHTHLGDILYPNGGRLIFKQGIRKNGRFDLIGLAEKGGYKTNLISEWLLKKALANSVTAAGIARNRTGTLENFRRTMDESGVTYSACMPIPPYVTFQDLKRAQDLDPGVIPFTGIDFTSKSDPEVELQSHVARGAKGLKLHPIIQKTPFTSPPTYKVLEAFEKHELPVLFHSGVQSYYLGEEKTKMQTPEYGELKQAIQMVKSFPRIRFIAGHAGIFEYRDAIDYLSPFENVYVDTSFQPSGRIRKLLDAFGSERVMFASDWPWGDRKAALSAVRKACGGDQKLEDLLVFRNAAQLLNLDINNP